MKSQDFASEWQVLSQGVINGMREWRLEHPKASLREIETALDERLSALRAQMLKDAALASDAADWQEAPGDQQPRCCECGTALTARGMEVRQVRTQGDQTLHLERRYGVCPRCQRGLFPPG